MTAGLPASARVSWREENRQDRLARERIGIEREEVRARVRIAEQDAAETRRAARARARRQERDAALSAVSGWVAGHVLDLLFVPVIGVPVLLAWTAMAVYGLSLYGGPGVLLPLFSEFSMWAFAAAVTITRRKDARRREADPAAGPSPVWHLRAGVTMFAVFAAALNAAHGMSPATPHHGPVTAAVMALISTAGVFAHQLITAGPRRTRADRGEARIGRVTRRRLVDARVKAVRRAPIEIGPGGTAQLIWPDTTPDTKPDTLPAPTRAPRRTAWRSRPRKRTPAPRWTAGRTRQRPPGPAKRTPPPDTEADTAPDQKRSRGRTRRGPSTADRVAAIRDRHPDMSAADIAARLKVSDRTVRRHLPKPAAGPQASAA